MGTLHGIRIGVLGGDRREVELCAALVGAGASVTVAGYPDLPELAEVRRVSGVREAVREAQVVLAPMSNTDDQGRVKAVLEPGVTLLLDEESLSGLPPGTPLLIGFARPCVRAVAGRLGLRVVELAEEDDIAILNSIPTAEGALMLAMEQMPITLHSSACFVLGFGRCGLTLARDLKALGAHVTVVARNPAGLARAEEMCLATLRYDELAEHAGEADCLFNTVPAPVLTRKVLVRLRREALIIDLASPPGGTDFAAAAELGLQAILAPGLPGKVAPKTAGRILARLVPDLIARLLAEEAREGRWGR